MYVTEFDGVLFLEGEHPQAIPMGPIQVSLDGILSGAQLKSLNDVKRTMAAQVLAAAGNAVIRFKYGQKSSSWFSLGLDQVAWYGKGEIAKLPDVDFDILKEKAASRRR